MLVSLFEIYVELVLVGYGWLALNHLKRALIKVKTNEERYYKYENCFEVMKTCFRLGGLVRG